MDCKWCGVERDVPAMGPHACDPKLVRERGFECGYDQAVQEVLDELAEHSPTLKARIAAKYPMWDPLRVETRRQLGPRAGDPTE